MQARRRLSGSLCYASSLMRTVSIIQGIPCYHPQRALHVRNYSLHTVDAKADFVPLSAPPGQVHPVVPERDIVPVQVTRGAAVSWK